MPASKVTFDGTARIIYVNVGTSMLDIRSDVYTAWVDWTGTGDNTRYLPAMRYTGLDPIGGGKYTGDIYFLINGWKLSVDLTQTRISGVLFSEDYETAFFTPNMIPQFPASVAALVNTVSIAGGSGSSAAELWNYSDRSLTNADIVVTAIDANSAKLAQIRAIMDTIVVPSSADVAIAVWSAPIAGMTDKTTFGGFVSKVLLSIPKFLGLK